MYHSSAGVVRGLDRLRRRMPYPHQSRSWTTPDNAPAVPLAGAQHTFIESCDAQGNPNGSAQEISIGNGSDVAISANDTGNAAIAYFSRNSAGIITGVSAQLLGSLRNLYKLAVWGARVVPGYTRDIRTLLLHHLRRAYPGKFNDRCMVHHSKLRHGMAAMGQKQRPRLGQSPGLCLHHSRKLP